MKLKIETTYILTKDNDEMFDTKTAVTEHEVLDRVGVDSVVDIHEQKLGKIERDMRLYVDDLLEDGKEKENSLF